MAFNPLDISGILKSKGIEVPSEKPKSSHKGQYQGKKKHDSVPKHSPPIVKQAPKMPPSSAPEVESVKISPEFWNVLNEESRRMLTSRIWRGVDFNPMLGELDDLSKLTEKWLKWAVPTYVNGVKEGPIKNWIEGDKTGKDFHYILVGEHLKHLKEVRQKKKDEPEVITESVAPNEEPMTAEAPTPVEDPVTTEAPTPVEDPVTAEVSTPAEDSVTAEASALINEPVVTAGEDLVTAEVSTPAVEPTTPVDETLTLETSAKEEPESIPQSTPVDTETLKRFSQSLDELDENIAWFQSYLDKNKKSDD